MVRQMQACQTKKPVVMCIKDRGYDQAVWGFGQS
jgi:hypothetical protein